MEEKRMIGQFICCLINENVLSKEEEYQIKDCIEKRKRRRLNTYLTGFCAGIKEVLDKQSTALMVIVPKEVEESYHEYSKSFRQISNKLRTSNDSRAYQDGKQDGRETATARTIEG